MSAAGFTFSEHTIMTGLTVINDANMVKGSWNEARGLVTDAAILGGRHMVWGRRFSSGGCTIVT